MRLIALFNLKPGVSPESYEAWAKSVDLPIVNALPSVDEFTVWRATGKLGSDEPVPYQYIEIIDVDDMAQFGADTGSSTMKSIAAAFGEMVEVTFMTTDQIVAESYAA
jgi:hypothetical protein